MRYWKWPEVCIRTHRITSYNVCYTKLLRGSEEKYELNRFAEVLKEYEGIDADTLKAHLKYFLSEIIPIAEKAGVRMAIHPDDPPFSLLGLPRVVSTLDDAKEIVETVDSPVITSYSIHYTKLYEVNCRF